VEAVEFGFEDGRFTVSASSVTVSNPDFLSSSETGVIPGTRIEKALI
jgi:hypothetical protein